MVLNGKHFAIAQRYFWCRLKNYWTTRKVSLERRRQIRGKIRDLFRLAAMD